MSTRKLTDDAIAKSAEHPNGLDGSPLHTVETMPPLAGAVLDNGSEHALGGAIVAWNRWIEVNGIPL
jgi:hypothetical protein